MKMLYANWTAKKKTFRAFARKTEPEGFSVGQLYPETQAEQGEQFSLSYEHTSAYSARFLIACIVNYFKSIPAKPCHQQSYPFAETQTWNLVNHEDRRVF